MAGQVRPGPQYDAHYLYRIKKADSDLFTSQGTNLQNHHKCSRYQDATGYLQCHVSSNVTGLM
ncbi:hypothetical protein MUK42_15439 [Musa troglodytarum]|uniref:Uncharacterized protein n=1 Tax=Musa troglodytarum TaxID=320322 RepID=A0A9E7GAC9_9LILI|nr:hypothetical protein MUK42_15439 [Musa troglodytarum]